MDTSIRELLYFFRELLCFSVFGYLGANVRGQSMDKAYEYEGLARKMNYTPFS